MNPGHMIIDLTVDLLERDTKRYLRILNSLSKTERHDEIAKRLNQKSPDTWESNHVHALSMLVGKMNQEVLEYFDENGSIPHHMFYGSRIPEGVDIETAICLLRKMIECGGDIRSKNYYEEDVMGHFENEEENRFYRTDNEEYIKVVKEIYESDKIDKIDFTEH